MTTKTKKRNQKSQRRKKTTTYTPGSGHASRYYSYSSAAREVAPSYVPKAVPVKKPAAQSTRGVAYHRFSLLMSIIIVFMCTITIIISFSNLTYKKSQVSELKLELRTLEERNKATQTEISQKLDLKYVEEVAINRLGMDKPADHQKILITVPKQSYTVVYNEIKFDDNKDNLPELLSSFINYIVSLFKGIGESTKSLSLNNNESLDFGSSKKPELPKPALFGYL